jgi:glutaredoxin-related protein
MAKLHDHEPLHCLQVVAFVKGTRTQPQCGFSYKMMQLLNDMKVEYEVVNVLDDFHNPGLREAIKVYSQWPTIPQVSMGYSGQLHDCITHGSGGSQHCMCCQVMMDVACPWVGHAFCCVLRLYIWRAEQLSGVWGLPHDTVCNKAD